jgi:hypothetical protein
MRWKNGIIIAIIFFGIGIIVGYSISGYVLLKNIGGTTNIISILLAFFVGLFGGSDVLGFISNWFKERKERRIRHEKDLIDTVIKPWYEHDKGNFVSIANYPFAIEHLRTGYYPLWKLKFKDCQSLKNEISEDEKKIKEYIENKSYTQLEHIFDDEYLFQEEVTEWGKVYVKKEAELIYELLDEFPDTSKLKDNYKIENSKEIIEIIIKDKTLYEMIERVNKNNKNLNKKSNEFMEDLKKIVYKFEKRGFELKGTCDDC